jgi:hypothetical protein
MPFDFRLCFEMFRLAFRDPMSPRRRKVVWFLAFALPLLAALNAICFALDRLLLPGFRRVEIREPIFIVGHARSGTSLLHRLLSADRARFSGFMMYEMFLPSLLQRTLVRWLGRCDARWLDGAVERRIRAWEDRVFAKGRQMHPMSLTGPEEDEFLMAIPFCSATLAMVFPYLRELQPYNCFDERLPEWRRRRVMNYYRECVRRQLYLNGAEKIHLSKNPVFSDKVCSLIETFPGARFVVMVRDPYETIPSIQKMMERNWKASDCDPERVRDSLEVLFENSISAYRHPFAVLDERRDTRWTVVRYEDLVASPKAAVEGVYRALDLSLSPEMEKSLAEEETRSREYRAEHLYSLEEYGLSRAEIRERLEPLFERFGWEGGADA